MNNDDQEPISLTPIPPPPSPFPQDTAIDDQLSLASQRRARFIERFGDKLGFKSDKTPSRILWSQLKAKKAIDDVMEMLEEDIEAETVAQFLYSEHKITASPTAIKNMYRVKSQEWLHQRAMIEAVERKLQTMDGSVPLSTISRQAAAEQLMTEVIIGKMETPNLIALQKLHNEEDSLAIRKLEAQRRLYEWQWRAANFISEFIKDQVRYDELKALAASKSAAGEDFIEAVRSRVYGTETINKPADYGHIGAK